jgi:hypothetical protein
VRPRQLSHVSNGRHEAGNSTRPGRAGAAAGTTQVDGILPAAAQGSYPYLTRPARARRSPFRPPLTSAEFNAALRHAWFSVDHGHIVDVSGDCHGFAALPSSNNKGAVDRIATLTKAIRERDAEIVRRAGDDGTGGAAFAARGER